MTPVKKMVMHIGVFAAAFWGMVLSCAAYTQILWVDDANYGKPGLDGSTPELAYGSIQQAVDAAQSGALVLVQPGDYARDSAVDSDGTRNRVLVSNKTITIRSTGGKAVTAIVGKKDPDDPLDLGARYGIGPSAVRCARVENMKNGNTAIFEGFTFKDGACSNNDNDASGWAGGLCAAAADCAFAVDCDFFNCTGDRGGAVCSATCVRCRFMDNAAANKSAACYKGKLVNCLVAKNGHGGALCLATAVNSTIEDNEGAAVAEVSLLLNSVLLRSANTVVKDERVVASNCVFGADQNIKCNAQSAGNLFVSDNLQLIAPLFEDYRPIAGSPILTQGNASHLSAVYVPDSIDLRLDLEGNKFSGSEPIAVGAFQKPSTPAGGAIVFKEPAVEAGSGRPKPNAAYCYAYARTYPEQWHLADASGKQIFDFEQDGVLGGRIVPLTNDTIWVMPPPLGTVITNKARYATKELHVHPEDGSDTPAETRGAESAPYRTLQAAIDAVPQQTYAIIRAAAGDYREGGAFANGHSNRVYAAGYVRVIGAGADKSFIHGLSDNESDDKNPDGDGRGKLAMRCASLDDRAIVQGFTLMGGRVAWDGGDTAQKNSTSGGAAFIKGNGAIADCKITDCVGYRGSAFYQSGYAYRCLIEECAGEGGGIRYTTCVSCVIKAKSAGGSTAVAGGCPMYHTTVTGADGQPATAGENQNTFVNSIFVTGSRFVYPNSAGCLIWNYSQVTSSGDGFVCADPLFADEASMDLRLGSISPALSCTTADNLWEFYSPDFHGNPMIIADGKPMAGAVQEVVQTVVAPVFKNGKHSGFATNALMPGAYCEVTIDNSVRPVLGFRTNGVEVIMEYPFSMTVSADGPTSPFDVLSVEPIFSTNWYVNAESGNDGSSGFSPLSAKQSFKSVMANVAAGDCVHAAPGVYSNEVFDSVIGTKDVRARLVIGTDVSVVSDEGPERTVIMGKDAASPDEYGLGAGSIRCVEMRSGARLSGFTVTGGRTHNENASSTKDNYGGGFYGNDNSLAENCIISNNASNRGGGAHLGKYVNCRFFGNVGTANRSATSQCRLYGCVIDNNKGDIACHTSYEIVNCTFGSGNRKLDGSNTSASAVETFVANSLFLDRTDNRVGMVYNNCIFLDSVYPTRATLIGCKVVADSELMLDGDSRPLLSSPVVDAGSNACIAAVGDLFAGRDAAGGQRIYNGRVDVGAYEADWRAVYAQALCSSANALTVEAASPGVVTNGETVAIHSGAIDAVWYNSTGKEVQCDIPVRVSGGGVLSVLLAGENLGTVTAEDGEVVLSFMNRLEMQNLQFAYMPCENDEGAAIVGKFSRIRKAGLVFCVR